MRKVVRGIEVLSLRDGRGARVKKMDPLDAVNEIAKACDGKITEVGILPDNSGFAIMSMPLRKDHWIYEGTTEDVLNGYVKQESYGRFNIPPMLFRMGAKDMAVLSLGQPDENSIDAGIPVARGLTMTKKGFADAIKTVGRYAVRCATMNGKEMDFDPDALLQNLVVGFLGYWTEDGLNHSDGWANPPQVKP
jgi:hypothetical protein